MAKTKITVLKRAVFQDLVDQYLSPGAIKPCERFTEGQEFIIESDIELPPNFCGWAWNDLYKTVLVLLEGKDYSPWTRDGSNVVLACCSDGYRPVVFKLEGIKD